MKKGWYTFVLIVLIGLVFVFASLVYNDPYNRAKRDRDFMGSKNASILVIEWCDYLDGLCAKNELNMKRLRDEFDVKFIYGHYVLSNSSRVAANAAECAGLQGKFEKMHELLYENYLDISLSKIYEFADQIKLKESEFKDCMEKMAFAGIIDRDFDIGKDFKIKSLPLVFINGKRFDGYFNYDVYSKAVNESLS